MIVWYNTMTVEMTLFKYVCFIPFSSKINVGNNNIKKKLYAWISIISGAYHPVQKYKYDKSLYLQEGLNGRSPLNLLLAHLLGDLAGVPWQVNISLYSISANT